MTYTFFMCALPHSELDNLTAKLEQYIDPSASYIIAMETANGDAHSETSGEHFHFAVEMTAQQYERFRHTVFNNQYKLRGRATTGKPRQYGKVKNVKDETKFLQYTVKSKNIIYKNIDLKTIQDILMKSYVKPDKLDFTNKLMSHLLLIRPEYNEEYSNTHHIYTDTIELAIVQFAMQHDKLLTKSFLKHQTLVYLQQFMKDRFQHTQQIYAYIKYN